MFSFLISALFAAVPTVMNYQVGTLIYSDQPRTWYSDHWDVATASTDQIFMLYQREGALYLLKANADQGEQEIGALLGLSGIWNVKWLSGSEFMVRTAEAYFRCSAEPLTCAKIEVAGSPGVGALSQQGLLGFWNSENKRLEIFDTKSGKQSEVLQSAQLAYQPIALDFNPEGRRLIYLAMQASGQWFELGSFDLLTGERAVLASDLDASWATSEIAVSRDGSKVYLNLVTDQSMSLLSKHQPVNERFAKIYSFDLQTKTFQLVAADPQRDLFFHGLSGERLLWTTMETEMGLGVSNFQTHETVYKFLEGEENSNHLFIPAWSPDGRQLSTTYGQWRWADWALNWDIGLLNFDPGSMTFGENLTPFITGLHEDFGAVWSPNGKWVAFHSHRTSEPVFHYDAGEHTDDIWIRAATGGPEIRVSRIPEAGEAEVGYFAWSPRGDQILFQTGKLWLSTINSETGEFIKQEELKIPGIEGYINTVSWNPVAEKNEIAVVEEDSAGNQVWLVQLKDLSTQAIYSSPSLRTNAGLDFTPDGDHLVFSALTQTGQVGLLKANLRDGANPVAIAGDYNRVQPRVSPDGRLVAFTAYRHRRQIFSFTVAP